MGYECGDLSRISPAFLAKLERGQSVKVKLTNGFEFVNPLADKKLKDYL